MQRASIDASTHVRGSPGVAATGDSVHYTPAGTSLQDRPMWDK
jgi:hypothetical protein